jgi:hypothetical protein
MVYSAQKYTLYENYKKLTTTAYYKYQTEV